jgi:hypothetical protein
MLIPIGSKVHSYAIRDKAFRYRMSRKVRQARAEPAAANVFGYRTKAASAAPADVNL